MHTHPFSPQDVLDVGCRPEDLPLHPHLNPPRIAPHTCIHIPRPPQDVLDVGCRPEDLIVSVIAVPPVTIRPSVDMDGASNEDDITMKLMVRWRGRAGWVGGCLREERGRAA